MISESEYEYNLRREIVERLAAQQATQPLVRKIHEDLAGRYAQIVAATKPEGQDHPR